MRISTGRRPSWYDNPRPCPANKWIWFGLMERSYSGSLTCPRDHTRIWAHILIGRWRGPPPAFEDQDNFPRKQFIHRQNIRRASVWSPPSIFGGSRGYPSSDIQKSTVIRGWERGSAVQVYIFNIQSKIWLGACRAAASSCSCINQHWLREQIASEHCRYNVIKFSWHIISTKYVTFSYNKQMSLVGARGSMGLEGRSWGWGPAPGDGYSSAAPPFSADTLLIAFLTLLPP